MRTETDQIVYLKDYAPSPYTIEKVELEVEFASERTTVHSWLTIVPRADTRPGTPLLLDGDELVFGSIALDGAPMAVADYEAEPDQLTVFEPPLRRFVLETKVTLNPQSNTRLMGLYRSSGVWCTQCEPEGFRRITYFLDRPDVLAVYRVRMIGNRTETPVLLANGNLIESGPIDGDKHYAVWDDPFPKPSYLFAMVAGDLGSIRDSFTTASGRQVALGIYCEHGKEEQCLYAMDALKRSMAWDERRFGREYDLDVFNIVAVSDFNFGAMENKGLNIFNDKFVLAKPDTATDADYDNIERVIAHEYFHNWTGNRITCRDWFQLCLKEGLTVYRDQEFSSDERSRAVKRIEDVKTLRAAQFPEDGGPLAHPPRPDHYREINNFYTPTVYEKGAEIVRMLATLLGEAGFRRGMDLYFERHDGHAATIEQFLAAFADANEVDLEQFKTWYLQAGTPNLNVEEHWDAATRSFTLRITQHTAPTAEQAEKVPVVIPIRFGLIGPNGSPMTWETVTGGTVRDDLIILSEPSVELRFTGLANRPVPSLLRGFSAPVKLTSNATADDQLFLARHDSDPFNRWQALQSVAMRLMLGALETGDLVPGATLEGLAAAMGETLRGDAGDDAFKALALGIPGEDQVAQTLGKNVDPDAIHAVRKALRQALAIRLRPLLLEAYQQLATDAPFSTGGPETRARQLRNAALTLLTASGRAEDFALAEQHYHHATNMTDRMAALAALVHGQAPQAQQVLADFGTRFTADPLALDKWLSLSAQSPDAGALERVQALLASPSFPRNNPNRLRSLIGAFANANPTQFGRADGAGFRFVADVVTDVDSRNPQVAARLLTAFRIWPNYEAGRKAQAEAVLRDLSSSGSLSRNTSDILERTLEG